MLSVYCYECNGTKRFITFQEEFSFLPDFYNDVKKNTIKDTPQFYKKLETKGFSQLLGFKEFSKLS